MGIRNRTLSPTMGASAGKKLPVIALNVCRELTKRGPAGGIDGLTEEKRTQIVDLDLIAQHLNLLVGQHWIEDFELGHEVQPQGHFVLRHKLLTDDRQFIGAWTEDPLCQTLGRDQRDRTFRHLQPGDFFRRC